MIDVSLFYNHKEKPFRLEDLTLEDLEAVYANYVDWKQEFKKEQQASNAAYYAAHKDDEK